MQYRQATKDDIAAIAALHHAGSWRSTYVNGPALAERLAAWRERLWAPATGQYVVVAEDNGAIVGFACAFVGEDPELGTLLDNLHVLQDWQRGGIGRRLVSATAKWSAAKYPGSGLYLWVLENNARARSFYEGIGGTAEDAQESEAPGGGTVLGRRYVWSAAQVAALASHR